VGHKRQIKAAGRFMLKVVVDSVTGCWVWQGSRTKGYGAFNADGFRYAHQWAYWHFVGEVPVGHELDHACNNKACCNPFHLRPVTHQQNILRSYRERTHCKHGHAFTVENTYYTREGWRRCRVCRALHEEKAREKRKRTGYDTAAARLERKRRRK
jgi:hypothetical protein